MLKIDGYNHCIVGMVDCWSGNERVERLVYDGHALIGELMNDGMDADEAREYIEFNIEGAYVGEDGPMVMWDIEEDDLCDYQ